MKFLVAQLLYFFQNKTTKRNLVLLSKFFIFLFGIITLYSVLFHLLMQAEGREYSWITGLYWTLTVMSTLGFGDITFQSDLGLFFTLLVLISGVILLLIMLPFSFIQFFYAPWLDAQSKARTPKKLPEGTKDHIIITNLEPISSTLIKKLDNLGYQYVIVEEDLHKALELYDNGYKVVVGAPDDPETYKRIHVENAALVVVNSDDQTNTNIAFTIREITKKVPIVTNADNSNSLDILNYSGNMRVFQFMNMLGIALAQRTMGGRLGSHTIGQFEDLYIAEALASDDFMIGKTLAEINLRQNTGVNIVGFWSKGKYQTIKPDTVIVKSTVLILAGSRKNLQKYDERYSSPRSELPDATPILILGGGRVGKAAAQFLEEQGKNYMIIEKRSAAIKDQSHLTLGDAADRKTLQKAGIDKAPSVIITTHDDAMNIYLTFYCRQLNKDIQIISRAIKERTVSKLHSAGADQVLSYANMGANAILDQLHTDEASIYSEGLNVFSVTTHSSLVGKALFETNIREETDCSVIGIKTEDKLITAPDPKAPLVSGNKLVLIGTLEAERLYRAKY